MNQEANILLQGSGKGKTRPLKGALHYNEGPFVLYPSYPQMPL